MDNVIYVPGMPWVIDFTVKRDDGVVVTQLHGRTLEDVQAQHPAAIITTWDDAQARIEAGSKTEPRQIDEQDFDYALNVLPPRQWVNAGGGESFKMSERTNGRITAIYARLGTTYWKFDDDFNLPHSEIMARVQFAQENRPANTAAA